MQTEPTYNSKKYLLSRQESALTAPKCDTTDLASAMEECQFLKKQDELCKNGDFTNISTQDNIGEVKSSNFMDDKAEQLQMDAIRKEAAQFKGEKGAHTVFPGYPSHGVIGSKEPLPANLFFNTTNTNTSGKDFKKQKFDFYEMYEKHLVTEHGIIKSATPLPGLGYLCRGFNTSNIYKTDPSLPVRFRTPDLLRGYGCERNENPLFRTTSTEYGKFAPTVHDVPHEYHGLKNAFTGHLTSTGMPKNRSLNIK